MADYLGNLITGNGLKTQTSTPSVATGPGVLSSLKSIIAPDPYKGLLIPSSAPVSPATKAPVAQFASATHTVSTPAATTLPNGATATAYGNTVTSPTSFSIDTSGAIPSSALGNTLSDSDVTSARNSYADYVNGLAHATQYSPAYINAYQNVQNIQTEEAALKGNLATGNTPGDTQGFAEGFTNRALMGAGAQEAFANVGLQAQELQRQGNIAGAKALVDAYAPTSISPGSSLVSPVTGETTYNGLGGLVGTQAVDTYANLQQNFPDANIPAYNQNLSPSQNLQIAQQAAQQAPSFQSRNLAIVTDSAGGIHLLNKNDVQGLSQNGDGTYTFLTPGQAASQSADKASLNQQTQYVDTVQRSLNTADANFTVLTDLMKRAGINDASSPIINQLNNKFQLGVIGNGDIAAFKANVASLQAEYAQVLARGGAVTDSVRNEANSLIPDNLTLNQLNKVKRQIQTEGANVVSQGQAQIQTINQRLSGPASSSGNGLYAF